MISKLLSQNPWLNIALLGQIFTMAVFLGVLFFIFSKKNKKKLEDISHLPLSQELCDE